MATCASPVGTVLWNTSIPTRHTTNSDSPPPIDPDHVVDEVKRLLDCCEDTVEDTADHHKSTADHHTHSIRPAWSPPEVRGELGADDDSHDETASSQRILQHCATTASSKPTLVLRTFSGGWVAEEQPVPEDTAASAIPRDETSVHGGNSFAMTAAANVDAQQPRRTSRLGSASKLPKVQSSPPHNSDDGAAEPQKTTTKPSFALRMSDALPMAAANTAPAGATTTAGGTEEATVKGGKHAFDLLQAAMHLANQPPARRKKGGQAAGIKRSRSEAVLGGAQPSNAAAQMFIQQHQQQQQHNTSGTPSAVTNNVPAPGGTVLASALAQVESLQQHNLQLLALNANLEQQLDSTRRMMFLQHQELAALRNTVQQMQVMQQQQQEVIELGAAVPVAPQ